MFHGNFLLMKLQEKILFSTEKTDAVFMFAWQDQ